MKAILVLAAFIGVGLSVPHPATVKDEWNAYKESYGKFYTSRGEEERRLTAYMETKQLVEEHNRKYERGETSFQMEINKFADWFPEELDAFNGARIPEDADSKSCRMFESAPTAPREMNWVEEGAVTRVKDQGRCGSCYAFSAVGALEAMLYLTNKTITDLSPQEFVDCTASYGNKGCNGGNSDDCYEYVIDKKGGATEKSYPYESYDGKVRVCRAQNGKIGVVATNYAYLCRDEDGMAQALVSIGPFSTYYGASKEFHLYESGVFDGSCYNGTRINHAMLIVGYGKDKVSGKDYWLVKNSWGDDWGLKGYVKIIRGVDKCGINTYNSFPIYEKK